MAKKSKIAKAKKQMAMIEKYADKRQELKAAGDRTALAKLPRDSNPNRLRLRDQTDGRPRGYMRKSPSRVDSWSKKSKLVRGGNIMAVPARKTSKAKKRLRRTHQTVVKPEISFDEANGDYRRSHHVSLKGYYNGKKVIKGASK